MTHEQRHRKHQRTKEKQQKNSEASIHGDVHTENVESILEGELPLIGNENVVNESIQVEIEKGVEECGDIDHNDPLPPMDQDKIEEELDNVHQEIYDEVMSEEEVNVTHSEGVKQVVQETQHVAIQIEINEKDILGQGSKDLVEYPLICYIEKTNLDELEEDVKKKQEFLMKQNEENWALRDSIVQFKEENQ